MEKVSEYDASLSLLSRPVSGGSMNPARTLGPALASSYYKGLWVYVVGPVTGTLLGAWSYNLIRVTETQVQENSQRSLSLKLRRMASNANGKEPLNLV